MAEAANTPTISLATDIGIDAITRILEIARRQLGTEVAFVAESIGSEAIVRFSNGSAEALPPNAGALAVICRAVADQSVPVIVPDVSLEPSLADARLTGALVALPIALSDDSPFGVLVCTSRDPDVLLRSADAGIVRVLSRAIGRLVEQHGLAQPLALRAEIDRIRLVLDGTGLAMVFQPIADLDSRQTVGFEALARFGAEPERTPDRWFAEAARVDLGVDLELTAVRAALASIDLLPPGAFLSVNASTATVARPEFLGIIEGIRFGGLVVELTDHAHVEDHDALGKAITTLRAAGVRIATDVSDAGFETLSRLLVLSPDMIKLDGLLIRGIDTDPVRRALATTIVSFAAEIDAIVVGESVQTEAELSSLRAIGVHRGQGNLLAPPGPLP